jgi:hypothetical protein
MTALDLSSIKPSRAKALMLAKRELSLFVYDAVQLEGINFSLPEFKPCWKGLLLAGISCLTSKLQ